MFDGIPREFKLLWFVMLLIWVALLGFGIWAIIRVMMHFGIV
jgi:hypothetical protein